MEMNDQTIKALLTAFDASDWEEMTVTIGGDRLHVSRSESTLSDVLPPAPSAPEAVAVPAAPLPAASAPAAPAPEATPGPAAPAAPAAPAGTAIESPSVGLFWRSPSPGAPPFVEVGGEVEVGATVAIVEVMKLMNHVTSPVRGTVMAIHPENGEAVEFGQALVIVDPAA